MILPNKHMSLNHSLIGVGGILIKKLSRPKTISRLWNKTRAIKEVGSFQRFVLTLDFLFALGLIEFKQGMIQRRISK